VKAVKPVSHLERHVRVMAEFQEAFTAFTAVFFQENIGRFG
jgi:hypothetical protein